MWGLKTENDEHYFGKIHKSPWSNRILTASVFPGNYSARYEICLTLPDFRYPEYRYEDLQPTCCDLHRVYIHAKWLGIKSTSS